MKIGSGVEVIGMKKKIIILLAGTRRSVGFDSGSGRRCAGEQLR